MTPSATHADGIAPRIAREPFAPEESRLSEHFSLELLQRLARAAEARDDETGRHIRRVGALAGRIARAVGLPESHALSIERAAPLHDVGKIGVPDAILRKRGTLTAQETEVMREHTVIGARILAGGRSELIRCAERIALRHHEWWDGRGYPDGVAGEAIPLEARIVAVADVYDALTHARPYRPARPQPVVMAEIRDSSGMQFDPEVVAAFLSVVRLGRAAEAPGVYAAKESEP